MKSLKGKWALITGSSRGIGQQIAIGLGQLDCNIIVHGRKHSHLNETLDRLGDYDIETYPVAADLGNMDAVDGIAKNVRGGPGVVDILYNNAAIQNDWKEIWEIGMDEWLKTVQVNLFAMIVLCNTFGPEMVRRGYGRIINLTSGIKDVPQLAPYSVTKAAVDKYSLDLAAELQGTNVLVNCLDPGWLRTDMGGPNGQFPPETVLPGALVPALLEDNGPSGRLYAAQDFKYLAI